MFYCYGFNQVGRGRGKDGEMCEENLRCWGRGMDGWMVEGGKVRVCEVRKVEEIFHQSAKGQKLSGISSWEKIRG